MNESLNNFSSQDPLDEELLAVERELAKLRPASVSPVMESSIARSIAPARRTPSAAAPVWRPLPMAWVALAACIALAFVWHISRSVQVAPPVSPPEVIVRQPEPGPLSLFQLRRAMARSDKAAMIAVDQAGHRERAAKEPRRAVLRAWNADDVIALLDEM